MVATLTIVENKLSKSEIAPDWSGELKKRELTQQCKEHAFRAAVIEIALGLSACALCVPAVAAGIRSRAEVNRSLAYELSGLCCAMSLLANAAFAIRAAKTDTFALYGANIAVSAATCLTNAVLLTMLSCAAVFSEVGPTVSGLAVVAAVGVLASFVLTVSSCIVSKSVPLQLGDKDAHLEPSFGTPPKSTWCWIKSRPGYSDSSAKQLFDFRSEVL